MASYTTYCLEFESEDFVPEVEDLPDLVQEIARTTSKEENYLYILEDTGAVVELDIDEEDVLDGLEGFDYLSRVSVVSYQNTSGYAHCRLFDYSDRKRELVADVGDEEASEPMFSSWDLEDEPHTTFASIRELKENYGFDFNIRNMSS